MGETKQAITGAASKAGAAMGTAGDTSKAMRSAKSEKKAAEGKAAEQEAIKIEKQKGKESE